MRPNARRAAATAREAVSEKELKSADLLDLQALRLLRAFFRIGDPRRRQEIVHRAEELASSRAVPAQDEADR
jgi:hypothetical protein